MHAITIYIYIYIVHSISIFDKYMTHTLYMSMKVLGIGK